MNVSYTVSSIHVCICDNSHNKSFTNSVNAHGPCTIYNDGCVLFSQINYRSYNRWKGPAIIHPDGELIYQNISGNYHRTDGPAVIKPNSVKQYWVDGNIILSDEFFLMYGVL